MRQWDWDRAGVALWVFFSDFGAWLSGFVVLLPVAKILLYWNLFFKNQAFASQAKPSVVRERH